MLEIEKIKLSEIKPYENNTKDHPPEQIEQIKSSILAFGFNDPIAIDKDNIIIAGHGRYIALKELGHEEADVIRLNHLTEDLRRTYAVAHNKITENGNFNLKALKVEFEELKLLGIDLELTGFTFEELETDFPDLFQSESAIEDEENIPEIDYKNPPFSEKGDLWILGRHRLLCGDSTKKEDLEKLINGQKIDMVYTDAPYGISIVNKNTKTIGNSKKEYLEVKGDDTTETAKIFYEIIKDKAEKIILWGGNYFLDFLPFSSSFIIWDKRGDMNSNHFADGEMAWCNFHTRIRIFKQIWNGMIKEGEKEERVHPTQKPVEVQKKILKEYNEENSNILDGFGGSGSSLIASEVTGMNCFMNEFEEYYVDCTVKRYYRLGREDIKLFRNGKEITFAEIREWLDG